MRRQIQGQARESSGGSWWRDVMRIYMCAPQGVDMGDPIVYTVAHVTAAQSWKPKPRSFYSIFA